MATTRTHAVKGFVDAGGLIAYATSFPDLYRRAATYVDKILKGARDSSLDTSADDQFFRDDVALNLCPIGIARYRNFESPGSGSFGLHNPFMRDGEDKLIRRSYWLDMDDPTLVLAMTPAGISIHLPPFNH